jgi:type II secretory pathway component PulK
MMNKKGTILIASLWILSILAVLAAGIGFRVSIEARLAKYSMEGLRASYLAKAGAAKAAYLLAKKPTANCDSIYECGITFSPEEKSDPEKSRAVFTGTLEDGKFSVYYNDRGVVYSGIADEERRININSADQKTLEMLLTGEGIDPAIAASIVQWRSPGAGLDDGYYQALPAPYECKHQKFSAVEELLLVKGVDRKVFDKIRDAVTVFGNPAKLSININTASEKVMRACGLQEVTVELIVNYRNGPDKAAGTKDDRPFQRVDDIEVLFPVLRDTAYANDLGILKNNFVTKSGFFRIESEGIRKRSNISKKVTYIASKDEKGKSKLLYFREE